MYGIDINFLSDRTERPVEALVVVKRPTASAQTKTPMLIGLACMIAALGGVGGYWVILQQQKKTLTAENAQLDGQLAELQAKLSQVETIRQQTQSIDSEIKGLAGVFERIRPWSAMVRDIQGRVPSRTQIASIEQVAPPEAAAGAAGAPAPGSPPAAPTTPAEGVAGAAPTASVAGGLEISGSACSFNDVNDFLLTLKGSPFLNSETIAITEANLGEPQPGRCPGQPDTGNPEAAVALVDYTITGDIKSIPASVLLDELNRQQESTGLAARIRALQATGAIE